MDKIIILQSSDGQIFETDMATVKCSGTIVKFLEANNSADIVPLADVNAEILQLVLVWAKHHKDELEIQNNINAGDSQFVQGEHHVDEPEIQNYISPWDRQFLQVDMFVFFKILLAAYDLDIEDLLDAGHIIVTEIIRNRALIPDDDIPPGG